MLMSTRERNCLGNVFSSILPLQSMLDSVSLVCLKEAVLPLLEVDLQAIGFPVGLQHLSKGACLQLCDAVLEEVRAKPLLKYLPLKVQNVDKVDLAASILFHTLEKPFPFYLLYNTPLNVEGVRNVETMRHQLPFLKLLLVSLRSVPRVGPYWYEGILYRGVDVKKSPLLKEKMADYTNQFAPGTRITFAAPTSTSTDPSIAAEFTGGIQFVICGCNMSGGPGGVLLDREMSTYDEHEVLLDCPMQFIVFASTKPDSTVVIFLKLVESSLTYLSLDAASLAAGSLRELVTSAGLSLPVDETLSRLRVLGVVCASDLDFLREDWAKVQASLGLSLVDNRKLARILDRSVQHFAPAPTTPTPAPALTLAAPSTPALQLPPGSIVHLEGHPRHLTMWPGVGLVVCICGQPAALLGPDGKLLRRLGEGLFKDSFGVAVVGNRAVFSDWGLHKLVVIGPDGTAQRTIGSEGSAPGQFRHPAGLAAYGQGELVVADHDNNRVQVLGLDGSFHRLLGVGLLSGPSGVAADRDGRVVVADCGSHKIHVLKADGTAERCFGGWGLRSGQFNCPWDVALDGEGRILVADCYNGRVALADQAGRWLGSLYGYGAEKLVYLRGVWAGGGQVLITEGSSKRLRVLQYE